MDERARAWIDRLGLLPHPEGGYFRELYRSTTRVERGGVARSALTTIYFLLAAGGHGRWHVVDSDEVFHFLAGDPLELLVWDPGAGAPRRVVLGALEAPEAEPVHTVRAGEWQATRALGGVSLVGCTVGPGFDFADFRFVADLPGHEEPFAGELAPWRELL